MAIEIRKKAEPKPVIRDLVGETIAKQKTASEDVVVQLENIEQTRKLQAENIMREGTTIQDAQRNITDNARFPEAIRSLVGLFDPNFDDDFQAARANAASSNITLGNAAAQAAVDASRAGILQATERANLATKELDLRLTGAQEERTETLFEQQQEDRPGQVAETKRERERRERGFQREEARFGFEEEGRSIQRMLRNVQMMDDVELQGMIEDPNKRKGSNIPTRILQEEKRRRLSENMALSLANSQMLLAKNNVRRATREEAALTTNQLLNNMSITRLAGLANEAKEQGLEMVPHPDLPQYMLPAGAIQSAFAERQKDITATGKALSEQSGNRLQAAGSINDARGKLFNLTNVSEASQARVLTLGQNLNAVQAALEQDKLVSASTVKAAEQAQKQADELAKSVVESQPKEAQPAMRQYIETGTVGRNQASTVLGVAAGRPGVFPEDHMFADSMKTFTDEIGSILDEQAGQKFVGPSGQINLAALSEERDIEELIDSALRRKPDIQASFDTEVMWRAVELAVTDLAKQEGPQSPWARFVDSNGNLSRTIYDNGQSLGAVVRSQEVFLRNLAEQNNKIILAGAPSDTNLLKTLAAYTQTNNFRERFNQIIDGQFNSIYQKSYGVLMAPEGNYSASALRSIQTFGATLNEMIGTQEGAPTLGSGEFGPTQLEQLPGTAGMFGMGVEVNRAPPPTLQETETKDTLIQALKSLTAQAEAEGTSP